MSSKALMDSMVYASGCSLKMVQLAAYHAGPVSASQSQAAPTEELRRLKAELKRVTEERDILKKAAAYFARQSG